MAKQLGGYMRDLEYEIVDKFDLRKVPREKALGKINRVSFLMKYGTLPSNGAIGCALAHKYCYEKLLDEDFQAALVLEDDVQMSSVDLEMVLDAMNQVSEFDVISLFSRNAVIKRRPVLKLVNFAVHRSVYYCHDAAAYIVSKKGAKKLLESQSPKVAAFADWPLHAWQMKFYLTMPSTIELSGRPTGVQTNIPEQLKLSYLTWFVYKMRRLIWKTIALVRVNLCGDKRVLVFYS
jgi:glycosyl transferase family 25